MKKSIILSIMLVAMLGSVHSFAQQVGDKVSEDATITDVQKNKRGKINSVTVTGTEGTSVKLEKGNLFKRHKVTITKTDGSTTVVKGRTVKRLQKKAMKAAAQH